jgi:PTH1 family peptidyl-tRNA hydrolase
MGNRLLVGLGNPGPEYEWTPHNLGFHVVELLAQREGQLFEPATKLSGWTSSDGPVEFTWSRVSDGLLVKPQTYMNLSGEVVAPLVHWQAAEPGELMVVFDDLDLPFGVRRLRPHGGTGGHKGMKSIVERLGTDRFPRLRIGVGRPSTDAARHVLSRYSGEEQRVAEASVHEAAEAAADWLRTGDIEKCMTRFHSRWNPGPAPSQEAEAEPARKEDDE